MKEKDEELLRYGHTEIFTLKSGVEVRVIVYYFKNDPNRSTARSGRVGQMTYRNAWDIAKWGY